MTVAFAAACLIRGRLYSLLDKYAGCLDPKRRGLGSKEHQIPSRLTGVSTHAGTCAHTPHVVVCV